MDNFNIQLLRQIEMDNSNNCFISDPSLFSHLEIDQDHECLKQFLLDQDKSTPHPPLHVPNYDPLPYSNMLHPNNNIMQDAYRNHIDSNQSLSQGFNKDNSNYMNDSYGGYTVLTPNPSPMAFNYNSQPLGSNFNPMDSTSSSILPLPGFDPTAMSNHVDTFMPSATTVPSTMPDFSNRQIRNDQYSPGISPTIASFPTPVSVSDSPGAGTLSASPMCNGENSSLSDSVISPATTQRTGSERSVETNPRSIESISSDLCSPRVDLESLIIQPPQPPIPIITNGKAPKVSPTPKPKSVSVNGVTLNKSGKPRKRRSAPKDKPVKPKKPPAGSIYHSEIADDGGIKLKISLTAIPQKKKRKSRKKSDDKMQYDEPAEQSFWGDRLPEPILFEIFRLATKDEGCIPFLVR